MNNESNTNVPSATTLAGMIDSMYAAEQSSSFRYLVVSRNWSDDVSAYVFTTRVFLTKSDAQSAFEEWASVELIQITASSSVVKTPFFCGRKSARLVPAGAESDDNSEEVDEG